MELKVTKDYSFPEARRLVERSMGPVTYASVAAMSGGPRSSPRRTPRQRVQLEKGKLYSKYTSIPSSPSSDVTIDPVIVKSIISKEDEARQSPETSSQEDEMESDCSEHIVSPEENSEQTELAIKESNSKEDDMEAVHSEQIEDSTVHPEMEEHGAAASPPPAAGSSSRGVESFDLADKEQESDNPHKSGTFYIDRQESILVMLDAKPKKRKRVREYMIKECLQPTEDILKFCGLNSAALTLNNRASQSSMSWSKDLFVTPSELKRNLGTCKLTHEQSIVIMMLVIHDLYSAANVLLKKWRKGKG
jgi:hypothetical protein